MLRDLRIFRRHSNAGKAHTSESNDENLAADPSHPPDSQPESDPGRAPLLTIQDQNPSTGVDQGTILRRKLETTPSKSQANGPDSSHLQFRTPEKMTGRRRFSLATKGELGASGAECGDDLSCHGPNSHLPPLCRGPGGGYGLNTPRACRTTGRASSVHSDCSSTQSTPTKSVSKPANSGFSNTRPPLSVGSRTISMASKVAPLLVTTPSVVNSLEVPHFELKEDPSFWMDHNVQVVIRVRPLNTTEKNLQGFRRCLKQESAHNITWIGQPETRFTFDYVACETINQEMLFRVAGLPMVENCMSGYNSCVFAYGQTGSGKTYTMLGEFGELEVKPSLNRGMTPRIFEFLFARIKAEEESRRDENIKYSCKCSFLEIYNEQITDLLDPSCSNLLLREDIRKGVYVENLSEYVVENVHDILKLLIQGAANRKVAATNMNRESSRSHSVFTCIIESRWEKDSTMNLRFARLNLVDLAGSERQKTSGAEGERLKEAVNINKSLSTLGHVIMVLADVAHGKQRHVPYRDSRLTFLLQDSLGGNSKTMIIANVSPSICSANETLSTLKFAQRSRLIQNNAVVNEDASGDVIALRQQIRLLKEELAVLKRQNVSRSLSFRTAIFEDCKSETADDISVERFPIMTEANVDELQTDDNLNSIKVSMKQLKSLEAILAGALRREKMADTTIKQLEAEIEQLNRLVRQREEDTQSTKMMLKFREDKIRRMESILEGQMPIDSYLLEEKAALSEEMQLLRAKVDRNPEVTRFALENIRLLDQLRRYQDFCEGEREFLLTDITELRNKLIQVFDGKSELDQLLKSDMVGQAGNSLFACSSRDSESLFAQLNKTNQELESCKSELQSCLETNERLTREINNLHAELNDTMSANHVQHASLEHQNSGKLESYQIEHQFYQSKAECSHDIAKQVEEILNLQLELDIVKTILAEERSSRTLVEERADHSNNEFKSAKERVLYMTKQYDDIKNELKDARSIIEAIESEQILLINDLEGTRDKCDQQEELLKKQDEEISLLRNQLSFHSNEITQLSLVQGEQKDVPLQSHDIEDSPLQIKLRKMQVSLEKARDLNIRLSDQVSQISLEQEMEEVRRQVEIETAEVIVCLQEELVALQKQADDSKKNEAICKQNLIALEAELKEHQVRLCLVNEENGKLHEVVDEKERELRSLADNWKALASEIMNILADGNNSLDKATDQMASISDSFPQRNWIGEQVGRIIRSISDRDLLIEELQKSLEAAQGIRGDMEQKLSSLKGATLAITEAQLQESNDKEREIVRLSSDIEEKESTLTELKKKIEANEEQIKKSELCATVAFMTVGKLSEMNEVHLREIAQVKLLLEAQLQESHDKEREIVRLSSDIAEKESILSEFEKKIEANEEQIKKSELCATAAFMTVGKLSEMNEVHLREIAHVKLLLEAQLQESHDKEREIVRLSSDIAEKESILSEFEKKIEDNEEQIKKSELCATAAFMTVGKLSEMNEVHLREIAHVKLLIDESKEVISEKESVLHHQIILNVNAEKEIQALSMKLKQNEDIIAELKQLFKDQERARELEKMERKEDDKLSKVTRCINEFKSRLNAIKSCMNDVSEPVTGRAEVQSVGRCTKGESHISVDQMKDNMIPDSEKHELQIVRGLLNVGSDKLLSNTECESSCGYMSENSFEKQSMMEEMQTAVRNLQDVQTQMVQVVEENKQLKKSKKLSQTFIAKLRDDVLQLKFEMVEKEEVFKLGLQQLENKLQSMENNTTENSTYWQKTKEALEIEVNDTKAMAAQKSIEAIHLLAKVEEAQATMQEADIMVNMLLQANETAKLDIEQLQDTKTTLCYEKECLVDEMQCLKLSLEMKEKEYKSLEKNFKSTLIHTKDLVLDLEDVYRNTQEAFTDNFESLAQELELIKSHVQEYKESTRSCLEETWCEIIRKDCALSVLHLCHMGILIERITGLDMENRLLQHGLCRSNIVIADLSERNVKSKKELEMCSILKGKLLVDINNGFNRIARKEAETNEFNERLNIFENKILKLQLQEASMLARSNSIVSELSVLMKDLDDKNRIGLTVLSSQEKLLAEKEKELEAKTQLLSEVQMVNGMLISSFRQELDLLHDEPKIQMEPDVSIIGNKRCCKDSELIENLTNHRTELIITDSFANEIELLVLFSELELNMLGNNQMASRIAELEREICISNSMIENIKLELILSKVNGELHCKEMHFLYNENEKMKIELLELQEDHLKITKELQDKVYSLEAFTTYLESDLSRKTVELRDLVNAHTVISKELGTKTEFFNIQSEETKSLKSENDWLKNKLLSVQTENTGTFYMLGHRIRHGSELAQYIDLTVSRLFHEIDGMFLLMMERMHRDNFEHSTMAKKFIDEIDILGIAMKTLVSENSQFQSELMHKDEIIKGILFDLSLLQEHASIEKDQEDELKEMATTIESLEDELKSRSHELDEAVCQWKRLEAKLLEKNDLISSLECQLAEKNEMLTIIYAENYELKSHMQQVSNMKSSLEEDIKGKGVVIERLEEDILDLSTAIGERNNIIEDLQNEISKHKEEKDQLDSEVLALKEKMEMLQAQAEENEAIATEARQIAKARTAYAEEKEEEVKLLEQSIEELECTVYALENQADIVKEEAEKQRLQREEIELELHSVRDHVVQQNVQVLQKEIVKRDAEIVQFKAHISELNMHAEAQAREYKQKFRELEAMAQQVNGDPTSSNAASSSTMKSEKSSAKPRGSSSPFKCIGLGLVQQINSEKDEDLTAARHKIEELESLAASRQKEIFMLNTRLAQAESMTHDVIRDLIGVKLDMTSLLDEPETPKMKETSQTQSTRSGLKEDDISKLKKELNEFIEERQSWLHEIKQKHSEMANARMMAEKLRQREQFLNTENEMLKVENTKYKKMIMELEDEVKKFSNHQNFQHRIHHHAKIKEENTMLKIENEDMTLRLKRSEQILSRVKEELARYRSSSGKGPYIDFDEEEQLRKELEESESERIQLAQKLLSLCTSILKAAGLSEPTNNSNHPSAAEEGLCRLKNHINSLENELEDFKLKCKLLDEKIRLCHLLQQISPQHLKTHENYLSSSTSRSPSVSS
ncbi:kinesin-like protein KIN-12E isoform X1 [Zingiber officinale]|uniref:kinesin-like protein KIN-12E isoform X1 n=2 Tax=Zingiber officinale TaxID=94328 RepID=UPI001C4AB9DA|nr:kinesin-like protein KIN-12E isoform X1 [Zingiber officinale]